MPGLTLKDDADLVQKALSIEAPSMVLTEIPTANIWKPILHSAAQMLPVQPGKMPIINLTVNALQKTELEVQLRKSSKTVNHTPDITLETCKFFLNQGKQQLTLNFNIDFTDECYAFVCFIKNEQVELEYSDKRISGILSVFNATNPAVSNYGKQEPTEDIGIETFEFWCPQRRPEGQNIAMSINSGLKCFSAENLRNGLQRPVASPNAWVAGYNDRQPEININWNKEVSIHKIVLSFDCDYDHPMENVLLRQPNAVQPFCATDVMVFSNDQNIGNIVNNHQAQRTIILNQSTTTKQLKLVVRNSNENSPVSLFEVRCY